MEELEETYSVVPEEIDNALPILTPEEEEVMQQVLESLASEIGRAHV